MAKCSLICSGIKYFFKKGIDKGVYISYNDNAF